MIVVNSSVMRWSFVLFVVLLTACTTATNTPTPDQIVQNEVISMKLSSPAFEHNTVIPKKFTCEAEDVNPELNIESVPEAAKSLVLIMDDPDAPPKVWEHWTVINIPPQTKTIAENTIPEGAQLTNDFGKVAWGGPCPPPGKVHHYQFKLYALDIELDLESSATKTDVEQAMKDHILEETVLVGTYER